MSKYKIKYTKRLEESQYHLLSPTLGILTQKTYNKASLDNLIEFYKNNFDQLDEYRKTLQKGNLEYTQMKLLDMAFWQIGFTSVKLELHDKRGRIDEKTIIQRKNNELTFGNCINRFIEEKGLDRNHLTQKWSQNKNKVVLMKRHDLDQ